MTNARSCPDRHRLVCHLPPNRLAIALMDDGATVRPFQLAVPDEPPAHREHFGGSADDAHYAVAPFAQEQEPRSPVAAPIP